MKYSKKCIFILISIFLFNPYSFAQEATQENSETATETVTEDQTCNNKCVKTERNLDSTQRRLDAFTDKQLGLSTKYELSLKDNELKYQNSIQRTNERAVESEVGCRNRYQSVAMALDQCRDGLVSSLLGTGKCDRREELNASKLLSCVAKAKRIKESTLIKNGSKYNAKKESNKIKYESRIELDKAKLERLQTRLAEARAKHEACIKC